MDFEEILLEVGDNGKYQKNLIMLFIIPTTVILPWFTMNIMFMLSVPEHWCNVPEVATSNLTIEQQRQLISPLSEPKCLRYDINYTAYIISGNYSVPENVTTTSCDNGWAYDTTYYDATAATNWNMYCQDYHYTSFVLTMSSVGSIIFTPIFGFLSDKVGRKITFFITLTVNAISSMASVIVTDFAAFVAMKTINGALMPSVYEIPYIIILELVAPEIRTRMNGLSNCSWTVGLCILPLIAYLTRNWVTLGYVTSSVTFLFFIYWRFIPESPRWLLSRRRYEEAATILKKIADKNGKSVDLDYLLTKLKAIGETPQKEKTEDDNKKSSSMDLLRYPQLRKIFLIITFCWVADSMSYYGLQLNVSNLEGSEFFNFFLTGVVEIPGYITSWVLIDRFGRRWPTAGFFLGTGIVCMLPAVVSGLPYSDIICSMLGKYCASGAFMATYQQASELYPTVMRASGIGMSSTLSTLVSLGVPYLIYLGSVGKAIPFVTIGLVCIIAGVLATFLPETLNENLPQTIEDVEEFAKNKKYFAWKRRRISVCRERRASLAVHMSSLDNIGMKEEKDRY